MTAYEFGKEHLFDPVGMDSVECSTDAQGISDGGNGFLSKHSEGTGRGNIFKEVESKRLFLFPQLFESDCFGDLH